MNTTFAQLGLPDALVRALAKQGITEPFPVQTATIPDGLAGRDVSGKAPTGSGKTLAFGLPVLATIPKAAPKRPTALILAPTRELAEQIKSDLAPLAGSVQRSVAAIYGGVSYGPQLGALRKGVDVLVATPGRLEDLMGSGAVRLGDTSLVVIDEGDRMADMGFLPAVRRILDETARKRQTLLFSATLDGDVAVLSRDYQTDPVRHSADAEETEAIDADHHFWLVERADRVEQTASLIGHAGRSVVFTRTRHGADRLSKQLARHGVEAVSMHGGRSQGQRTRALDAFSNGRVRALVATDVAARGIHVDSVDCVVHYDPPEDAKTYIHRSGRTARAGAKGTIVSLVSHSQRKAARRMQRDLDIDVPIAKPRLEDLRDPDRSAPKRTQSASAPKARRGPEDRQRSPRPKRDRGNGDGQRIYVANLPWKTTAAELESVFGRHGDVHEATVVTDRRSGRSRGFGFVAMPSAAARTAIDSLHGSSLEGRDLIVRVANPKKPRR